MEYTKLGNSDLTVSRICMGCMGFGDPGRGQHSWTIGEEHARQIIRRGLDQGNHRCRRRKEHPARLESRPVQHLPGQK